MTPADTPPLPGYEQSLVELDRILRDLEDGSTTLEESLARYERGILLLNNCYGRLKDAELRIQKLTGLREDGTPELAPFEHISTAEKHKPRRRTNAPLPEADED